MSEELQTSIDTLPAELAARAAEAGVTDIEYSRGMDGSIRAAVATANRIERVFIRQDILWQCMSWLYLLRQERDDDRRADWMRTFVLHLLLEFLQDPRGGKLTAEEWTSMDEGFVRVVEQCVDMVLADTTPEEAWRRREQSATHVSRIVRILADNAIFEENPPWQ